MRKALKTIGIVLLVVVILAGGLIGYLTITEFRPASVQDAAQTAGQTSATLQSPGPCSDHTRYSPDR